MGGRIVHDSRTANIHHGEPKNLRVFFKKELWRGSSGLKAWKSQGFPFRDLPSFIWPLWHLIGLIALVINVILSCFDYRMVPYLLTNLCCYLCQHCCCLPRPVSTKETAKHSSPRHSLFCIRTCSCSCTNKTLIGKPNDKFRLAKGTKNQSPTFLLVRTKCDIACKSKLLPLVQVLFKT